MWEFSITINIKNKSFLNYILKEIRFAKINVISAFTIEGNEAKITIAVEVKFMQKLANVLVDSICNIVLYTYKKEYFKSNLNLNKLDSVSKATFLKALVMFDSECDKEEIKQELILHKELNLNSFYHFKLGFLKDKWQEILNIVNYNFSFSNNCNFMELIKFLVNNLESHISLANVYFKHNKFLICDNKNLPMFFNDKESGIEPCLLSHLIELNPKLINLYCSSSISSSTLKILCYIFDKKINLMN